MSENIMHGLMIMMKLKYKLIEILIFKNSACTILI